MKGGGRGKMIGEGNGRERGRERDRKGIERGRGNREKRRNSNYILHSTNSATKPACQL